MSKLNKDVLSMILEELVFDKSRFISTLTKIEKKSLYSCLFVNRLWCEAAVPILWSNPWKFVVNSRLLLNVIILFLPKESQDFLINQGIYIFSTKHNRLLPPLFDYIRYCKYIDFHRIEECISNGLSFGFNKGYQIHAIEQEIYKLLVSRCPAIKFLDMMESPLKHQIYHFTGAKLSLGELTFLCCESNIDSTFFYGLAHVCKLLQKICIGSCPIDNSGLARLIEVQKNLKCFACSVYSDVNNIQRNEIGNALINQANSLIHLKLIYEEKNFLLLKILPTLINLQNLKLINFTNDDYLLESQLEISTFSKLRVFRIEIISSLEIAIKLIKRTEGNLSEVLLGGTLYDESHSRKYIRAIYQHCPNIKILSLGINFDDYEEFEILLEKCQHLQKIVIDGNFSNGNLLLEKLAKSAPNSLREIRIFNDWMISANDLELFFENWRGREPILLYFFIENDHDYFKDSLLSILEKYREEGVVKNYRYDDEYRDFYFSW